MLEDSSEFYVSYYGRLIIVCVVLQSWTENQAKVARDLAWCPPASQAKTRDTCDGALLGACEPSQGGTGPCLVPAREPSRDMWRVPRGLAWCPRAKPRHATRAMWPCLVPTSRAKTHDACHLPCHGSYNDPRYGARGCARTRDPCHDACHDPHAMVPRHL